MNESRSYQKNEYFILFFGEKFSCSSEERKLAKLNISFFFSKSKISYRQNRSVHLRSWPRRIPPERVRLRPSEWSVPSSAWRVSPSGYPNARSWPCSFEFWPSTTRLHFLDFAIYRFLLWKSTTSFPRKFLISPISDFVWFAMYFFLLYFAVRENFFQELVNFLEKKSFFWFLSILPLNFPTHLGFDIGDLLEDRHFAAFTSTPFEKQGTI